MICVTIAKKGCVTIEFPSIIILQTPNLVSHAFILLRNKVSHSFLCSLGFAFLLIFHILSISVFLTPFVEGGHQQLLLGTQTLYSGVVL